MTLIHHFAGQRHAGEENEHEAGDLQEVVVGGLRLPATGQDGTQGQQEESAEGEGAEQAHLDHDPKQAVVDRTAGVDLTRLL